MKKNKKDLILNLNRKISRELEILNGLIPRNHIHLNKKKFRRKKFNKNKDMNEEV